MRSKLSCRVALTLFGIAILSGAALAQQQPAATAIADSAVAPAIPGSRCTTTTVYLKGVMDNFATPHAATPSPALAAFLSTLHPVGYDVNQANHAFGDSFRLCSCETCGAKIEIRVRKVTPIDQPANDDIYVGVAPFATGQRLVDGRIWSNNNPEPAKTLTYNLDAGQLTKLLCRPNQAPWLDVYIEDDTEVDWIRLTILHP